MRIQTHCKFNFLVRLKIFIKKLGKIVIHSIAFSNLGISGLLTPSEARVSWTENAWEEMGDSLGLGRHHLEEHCCKGEEETRVTGEGEWGQTEVCLYAKENDLQTLLWC